MPHPVRRRLLTTSIALAALLPLPLVLPAAPASAATRTAVHAHARGQAASRPIKHPETQVTDHLAAQQHAVKHPRRSGADRRHAVARLTVSAPAVAAGRRVSLSGAVTARGRVLAGVRVAVQQRVHGRIAWHTLAHRRTDAHGRMRLDVADLRRSHDFRLRYQGDAATAPATSAVTLVQALQQVRIDAVSDLHPTAGDSVRLSGTAVPGISGRRAELQLATATGWQDVASTRVPTDGAFTVAVRSMAGGEQQYRVLVVGDAGVLPATSAPQTFEVAAWYRLAGLSPLASTSLGGGLQRIAVGTYEQSLSVALASGNSAYADYALDYRCRALRAVVGPSTDASGLVVRFTAQVDDARPVDLVVPAGASVPIEADVSGGRTLRLITVADAGSGRAVWGDVEVLCTGAP